jgi:molybdopterin-containing oxidoreductase family iron-sulfur binding subunit
MTHDHDHHHRHDPGLDALRGRLATARGPQFWRSLEELAGTEAFQEYLAREFPSQAEVWTDTVGRRRFLQLMGASLALAGVSGCAFQPPESIVPAVQSPEQNVPGKPLFFASALTLGGYATGVLVESWSGRPTKVEGNPDHPANRGGSDVFMQAAILGLYDPDRSQVVTRNGRIGTWDDVLANILKIRDAHKADGGAGLRVLTEVTTSPTLVAQFETLRKEFPQAKWYQYDPVGRDNDRAGAMLAFGEDVQPIHHLDRADVIVSLDADFLTIGPARLRDARDFAGRREPEPDLYGGKPRAMNRLYVAEPSPTCTGSLADHRFRIASSRVGDLARLIALRVGVAVVNKFSNPLDAELRKFAEAVGDDLKAHRGSSLVIAGVGQPPLVHALAHQINAALGNAGKTVDYIAPVEAEPADRTAGLRELVADMKAGKVATLAILGGNPVYDAPADLGFAEALRKVKTTVRLGLYEDETSAACQWHIPESHPLESWGDALAYDGTATIIQPLIAPLYGGKSAIEFVAALATGSTGQGLSLVQSYWKAQKPGGSFDAFWRKTLRDGVVAGSAAKPRSIALKPFEAPPSERAGGPFEVVFRPDPTVWDGRFANNGWLQELPKPFTRLTWDNAALVSPRTAKELGLRVDELYGESDVIELAINGRKLRIPAWVTPGQADGVITVHLGYGRTRAGRVGTQIGFDTYRFRTADAAWFVAGASVVKTSETYRLANVQHHHLMEDRELVRVATLAKYEEHPRFAQEPDEHVVREATLYEDPLPQHRRNPVDEGGLGEGNAWGMAINLNTCIGCNACVVACQSENNIPIVGKEQVLMNREMHWIRIDRYFEGSEDEPTIHHQPVTCMQCEKAPCELVCPVAATTHSAEGLNEMTYNRCVGTRYCSNNCPYKVRRFNFLQFSDETTPSLKLGRNPDVTVRPRGVMEKCTYCVQRISAARIAAEGEDRRVGGNEVVTACQGACPTRAIVFGNLNDRAADVVKHKASPRNYALLAELNTRPRTTYVAKLTNPNPALPGPAAAKEG